MLRHIESNVDSELDKWTVRHCAGSLQSAYAQVCVRMLTLLFTFCRLTTADTQMYINASMRACAMEMNTEC